MEASSTSRSELRSLWESISYYDGGALHEDVLMPWLAGRRALIQSWLAELGGRSGPEIGNEDHFALYALSRVIDALLVAFPVPRGSHAPSACGLTLPQFEFFAAALGLRTMRRAAFSPFFHEIVSVDQSDEDDREPLILREYWPCLMLGEMLVTRAGVALQAGRSHIRKEIAENSRLYWASRRSNRPRADLSDGWGSNSAWATAFRLDFCSAGLLVFNHGQSNDLALPPSGEDRDGLTRAERIELLTHRCFVRCEKSGDDLWPYDDTLVVSDEGA